MKRIPLFILVLILVARCKQEDSVFDRIEQPFVTILPDSVNMNTREVKFKFVVSSDCYSKISTPLFRDEPEWKEIKILISDHPPFIDCNELPFLTNVSKVFRLTSPSLTINFLDKSNEITVSRSLITADYKQASDYLWKIYFDIQAGSTIGDSISIAVRNASQVSNSTLIDTLHVHYNSPSIIAYNNSLYDSLYYNVLYDDGIECNHCMNKELFSNTANLIYIKKNIPEVIRVYIPH